MAGVGASFCVMRRGHYIRKCKLKPSKYCTAFQGELLAIKHSLDFIRTKNYPNTAITVCTYNESVLKALMNSNSTTTLIQNIFSEIRNLLEINTYTNFRIQREDTEEPAR
jgi:hypothetical protein